MSKAVKGRKSSVVKLKPSAWSKFWQMSLWEMVTWPLKRIWLILSHSQFYKRFKKTLQSIYKYLGYLFLLLGQAILHRKSKYLLLSSIISSIFQTDDIYV